MTLSQTIQIVRLFKDVLYIKGEDIYFYNRIIFDKPCKIMGIESNVFCITSKDITYRRILVFTMNEDCSEIREGVCGVQQEVYYNNRLSTETKMSLFNLNIDISYIDKDTNETKFYDKIGALRQHTLNNIIND